MELDYFCRPQLVTQENGNIVINYNHGVDCIFAPNTGYEEIDNYFILLYPSDDNFYFGTAYKSKFAFINLDKGVNRNLIDIVELYEDLDINSAKDLILLHNYCCRRLREEINKLYPEYSLTKISKK